MKPSLSLKTYTDKELEKIIPALGTFFRPLSYNDRYIASCSHYLDSCSDCPFNAESDLCDSVYAAKIEDIEYNIDYDNKFFPRNFIEKHPEYLI